jgi:hypothetical protein
MTVKSPIKARRPLVAALTGAVTVLGLLTPAAASAAGATRSLDSAPPSALPAGVQRACPVSTKPGVASCTALVSTPAEAANTTGAKAKGNAANAAAAAPLGYAPSDLRSAYGLQSATQGMRQTVAIITYTDDPSAAADLSTYRSQYGLPACTTSNGCFQQIDQAPGIQPDSGWAREAAENMDVISAVCPNCHIMLVEAAGDDIPDLGTAVDTAVSDGADFVDNGYYSDESASETSYDSYYNHPGVAMVASASQDGFAVSYPAASPYVTAVGGTELTPDTSVARGWDETAWSGTGSGCSAYEPKPAWQTQNVCATRMDNDVSAVAASASSETPVAVYDSYNEPGWIEEGGTAIATAVITGVYALSGTPAAGSNPASYPYSYSHLLNDVTSGSNGTCSVTAYCNAGTGYDGPSGLGAPAAVEPFTATGKVTGPMYLGTGGMCADDNNNSTANGALMQIYNCNGDANQQYTVEADGTIQHGGHCLGLDNGTTSGTFVWLYQCDGATTQQWRPHGSSGALMNVAAKLCLGVDQSVANHTKMWIYPCNGLATQNWALPYAVPVSAGAISSQAAPTQCIDTKNGATSASTLMWIFTCNGSNTQKWTIEANGTVQLPGTKCMDVANDATANGSALDLYPCAGTANERWIVRSDGSFYNPQSGRCVYLSDGSTNIDTDLWIYDCSNEPTEQWTPPAVSS